MVCGYVKRFFITLDSPLHICGEFGFHIPTVYWAEISQNQPVRICQGGLNPRPFHVSDRAFLGREILGIGKIGEPNQKHVNLLALYGQYSMV